MNEIEEAIEQAAGAGDDAINHSMASGRSTASPRRLSGAREVIKRFLQNVPEHMTASEMLDEID